MYETIITVAATVAGFSVPTWFALSKIYYQLGEHQVKIEEINKKLDTLNGSNMWQPTKKGK